MNTAYLTLLNEAAANAKQTKATVDASNANDFYSSLDAAVPQWQRIRRRSASAASDLAEESASIIDGELPEGLSLELDALASSRNRAQGRYGPAADLSRVNMRASKRLQLKSEVGPQLMQRALALLQGAGSLTPKQMSYQQAYGNSLQIGFQHDQFQQKMDLQHRAMQNRFALGTAQLDLNSELGNASLDLEAGDSAWKKSWNKEERKVRRAQDAEAFKWTKSLYEKYDNDRKAQPAPPEPQLEDRYTDYFGRHD